MLALLPLHKCRTLADVPTRGDWVERFFEDFGAAFRGDERGPAPDFDISETDKHLILKADLPGIDAKELEISINDNVLTLKGEKKEEREEKKEHYHRVERRFGSFCRSFRLPGEVKTEGVEAFYKDGVLKVTIPKGEAVEPKKIEIKVH